MRTIQCPAPAQPVSRAAVRCDAACKRHATQWPSECLLSVSRQSLPLDFVYNLRVRAIMSTLPVRRTPENQALLATCASVFPELPPTPRSPP